MLGRFCVLLLALGVAVAYAKHPTQFAPEHWLREDTSSIVPPLGYSPTPDNIPPEFDCAWREYGTLLVGHFSFHLAGGF